MLSKSRFQIQQHIGGDLISLTKSLYSALRNPTLRPKIDKISTTECLVVLYMAQPLAV